MATVELEIPPRSAYVGVVRLAVASLARAAGFDEETVYDLRTAVSEACANAVLGQEASNTDEPISVTFSAGDGSVELEVADRAPAAIAHPRDRLDDRGVADANPEDSQGFDTRSTMSLALLQSLVDECTISPRDGGGTITHLSVSR